jgi:hypothetical protein
LTKVAFFIPALIFVIIRAALKFLIGGFDAPRSVALPDNTKIQENIKLAL